MHYLRTVQPFIISLYRKFHVYNAITFTVRNKGDEVCKMHVYFCAHSERSMRELATSVWHGMNEIFCAIS